MQKSFVTVLLLCSAVAAFAQGTVQFSNNALSRISAWPPAPPVMIPVTVSYNFGLFYGIGQSTSLTFLSSQLGVSSTVSAGVIANPADRRSPLNTVGIPGTTPGEADVWIQFKVWDSSFGTDWQAAINQGIFFHETQIVNVVPLGPATGPGVAIWQGATGTVTSQIQGFAMWIPEPSTFALAGLGAAALMIFRRRQ